MTFVQDKSLKSEFRDADVLLKHSDHPEIFEAKLKEIVEADGHKAEVQWSLAVAFTTLEKKKEKSTFARDMLLKVGGWAYQAQESCGDDRKAGFQTLADYSARAWSTSLKADRTLSTDEKLSTVTALSESAAPPSFNQIKSRLWMFDPFVPTL